MISDYYLLDAAWQATSFVHIPNVLLESFPA